MWSGDHPGVFAMSKTPRPWSLSLALVWNDANGAIAKLNDALRNLRNTEDFKCPRHHLRVPENARHCTAFAILEITSLPSSEGSLREFAKKLLRPLATSEMQASLAAAWKTAFQQQNGSPVLSLRADKVRVFDDGTTIQFCDSEVLARFRDRAWAVLAAPVGNLLAAYSSDCIKSLLNSSKSRGDTVFGSVARSPCRSDGPQLRWEAPLPHEVTFRFERVHLVTSDGWLTNPRERNVEDYLIPRIEG